MDPSFNPYQEAFVTLVADSSISPGSNTSMLEFCTQPFPSVTLTWYVPAVKFENTGLPCGVPPFNEYMYGVEPPEAPKVILPSRSEERRVGKECRSRWSAEH